MRYSLYLAVASVCIAAEPGPWRTLLQEDSFDGWRSPSGETDLAGAWTIRGGVLTVKPYVQRRTDIWSVDNYENFELEWEWKADKAANSGIKYWVRNATTLVIEEENKRFRAISSPGAAKPGEITTEYITGLEYQMADDAHEPDSLKRKDHAPEASTASFLANPKRLSRTASGTVAASSFAMDILNIGSTAAASSSTTSRSSKLRARSFASPSAADPSPSNTIRPSSRSAKYASAVGRRRCDWEHESPL
ncbi:MAG: DUF1080 domain-containing protein [Bryobacteraceae bacterium]